MQNIADLKLRFQMRHDKFAVALHAGHDDALMKNFRKPTDFDTLAVLVPDN